MEEVRGDSGGDARISTHHAHNNSHWQSYAWPEVKTSILCGSPAVLRLADNLMNYKSLGTDIEYPIPNNEFPTY
jgi:hypothetical protein